MIMETPVRASPVPASPVLADFSLPPELEAHEPPEARASPGTGYGCW